MHDPNGKSDRTAQNRSSNPESRLTEVQAIKLGIEILHRFNRAIRMSKIYDPNNLIFISQVRMLLRNINNALEAYGKAEFSLRQSLLLFNKYKLKFGYTNYYLFQFINEEFPRRDIGELRFLKGVQEHELINFVLAFAKKTLKTDDPHKELLGCMKQSQIENIITEKIPSHEKLKNKERAIKRIFFLSITHLKEIFRQEEKKTERAPLLTTKRLMQSIFNHLSDNESFLYGLTNIKNFDEYTLNHSVNVCVLSISLGKKLEMDRNELVDLGLSAFFHDFGKLDIPKEVLLKPGKLSEEERKIMEQHPHFGAEKLVHLKEFSYLPLPALNVAMEHHAREDEAGYPKYSVKKNINLYSKIVKITDVFDAITTKRPYRKNDFTREEALNFMLERSGTEFDPLILKIFVNMMGALPVGTLVLLNTSEIGIVYESNPDPKHMVRPKVKPITDREGNKLDGDIEDLTEIDPVTKQYKKFIIKSLDPGKYEIRISDYFVAEAT